MFHYNRLLASKKIKATFTFDLQFCDSQVWMISFFSQEQTVVSDTQAACQSSSGAVCKRFSAQSVRFKIFAHFFVLLVAVSFLLLLPGLNQHGIITKYAGMAKREINKLMKQKEKKNE